MRWSAGIKRGMINGGERGDVMEMRMRGMMMSGIEGWFGIFRKRRGK